MRPRVSIERFAGLRAAIEREVELDRVLESADLLRSEWTDAETHWQRELAREVLAGRSDLAERYLAAFFAGSSPKAIEPAEPAPREGKAPSQVYVPTYLAQAQAKPVAASPAIAQLRTSAPPLAASTGPSSLGTPIVVQPRLVAPAPQPQAAPPQAALAAHPGSTMWLPDDEPAPAKPLPFAAERPQAPSTAAQPQSTFFHDGSLPTGAAPLPFQGKGGAPAAQPVAHNVGTGTEMLESDATDVAAPGPKVPEGLPSLSVEQWAWMTAMLKRTPAAELDAALARVRLTAASRAQLQALWSEYLNANPGVKASFLRSLAAQFDAQAPAAPGAPPAPTTNARGPAPAHSQASLPMPIEHFAALQLALSGHPDRDAVLRARGIDPAHWPEVLRRYGEAMQADPSLRLRYDQAMAGARHR